MEQLPTLNDLNFSGKKALVRVDFNVPLDKDNAITDTTRIEKALPTLQHILDQGGSIILLSHLGRPKGEKVAKYSLKPVAKALEELLQKRVLFVPETQGERVTEAVQKLQPGQLLLLENVRFEPGEEQPEKDPSLSKTWASLADLYVNDAFGTAHRAHTSTTTIASHFPATQKCAGFLLEKECRTLSHLLENPERPFFALLGGAKISTKLGVIENLLDKVDALFLGGAMVYTFMKAKGISIGKSLFEEEYIPTAKQILARCEEKKIPLHLPKDVVVADKLETGASYHTVTLEEGIPDGFEGVDIGETTRSSFSEELKNAKTVLWNGPVGVFEIPPFDAGTLHLAKVLGESSAVVIVGGGDSVLAIKRAQIEEQIYHISTGGGASLEFLEQGTLPGIEALKT